MSINVNPTSSMDEHIANIRMCESDRESAQEHMHDADVLAYLFHRAVENLRSARRSSPAGTRKLIDRR